MISLSVPFPSLPSKFVCVGSRAAHSCDKVHNCLYIFGGWNGKNALNDLYILDLDRLIWYVFRN